MGAGHISPFPRPEAQPSAVDLAEKAWGLRSAMLTAGVIAVEHYYATPRDERIGTVDEALDSNAAYQASREAFAAADSVLYLEGLAQ